MKTSTRNHGGKKLHHHIRHHLTKKREHNVAWTLAVVALAAIWYAVMYYQFAATDTAQKPLAQNTPKVEAARPLPTGRQPFTISSGEKNVPRITGGYIDPYDPKIGAAQTIAVNVEDENPVDSVRVAIETDRGSKTHLLKLASGTRNKGTWEGSWRIDDSYNQRYRAILIATSRTGKATIELTLR